MNKYILVFNAGSSTLKFGLFHIDSKLELIGSGNFERIGLLNPFLEFNGKKTKYSKRINYSKALKIIVNKLDVEKSMIKVIGHRVVHGGNKFFKPTLVTKKVWKDISKFNDLAPLHNHANLEVIKACYYIFPKVKNVAVFDTSFFQKLKPEYYLYAIPYELFKNNGIRRYGFHGISHQLIAKEAAKKLKKPLNKINLITIHLGSGCSIVAIKKGVAIKTSLGFTPLDGLVMGTRSGDLDPSIPLYLQKKLNKSVAQVEEILNKKSGLLGLSGFTSDMREILKASGHKVIDYHGKTKFTPEQKRRAKIALNVFITRLRTYITLYTSFLHKVEAIVFTGGIGERSPVIRKLSTQNINFISKPKILTIPSNEEKAIAEQVKNIV
ncbi:MAG: acetate/propionate family kinase [Candidatus Kerfeldbacteria bacterium]